MTDPQRVLARMPWMMALALGTMGAVGPYLALELRDRGVDGAALTLTMTAMPVARVALGPAWGLIADRFQAEGATLRAAAALMALGALALALGPVPALLAAVMVFTFGSIGVIPVLDGMTLKALGGDPLGYGRIRRWGSAGFLAVALAAGALRSPDGVSPLLIGGGVASVLFLLSLSLPAEVPPARVSVLPALRQLARDRALVLLMLATALHLGAHGTYNAYFAVHVEDLGFSSVWTGVAIAGGIIIEIGVMSAAGPLLKRFGAAQLFLLAVALSIPRWLGTAMTSSLWVLVALQATHGITFGAAWVAMVALVTHRAPKEITNSAQGLLGGTIGGLGAVLGVAGGGVLLDYSGAPAVFLGATAAAIGAMVLGGLGARVDAAA